MVAPIDCTNFFPSSSKFLVELRAPWAARFTWLLLVVRSPISTDFLLESLEGGELLWI